MSFFGRTEPSAEDLIRHAAIKKNITAFFATAIKKLQKDHVNSEQPVHSEATANHVCSSLEAVFLHELKGSVSHRLSGYITGSSSMSESELSFWHFLTNFTHKDVLSQLNHLGQITTEVGMCRAWIRLALNDGVIESYIDAISKDYKTIRQYYKRTAYWRDMEQVGILKSFILGLSTFTFELSYNSSVLNIWSSTPLSLAGLSNAPLPNLIGKEDAASKALYKMSAQHSSTPENIGATGQRTRSQSSSSDKRSKAKQKTISPSTSTVELPGTVTPLVIGQPPVSTTQDGDSEVRSRLTSDVSVESCVDVADCMSSDNCTSDTGDSGHWTETSIEGKPAVADSAHRQHDAATVPEAVLGISSVVSEDSTGDSQSVSRTYSSSTNKESTDQSLPVQKSLNPFDEPDESEIDRLNPFMNGDSNLEGEDSLNPFFNDNETGLNNSNPFHNVDSSDNTSADGKNPFYESSKPRTASNGSLNPFFDSEDSQNEQGIQASEKCDHKSISDVKIVQNQSKQEESSGKLPFEQYADSVCIVGNSHHNEETNTQKGIRHISDVESDASHTLEEVQQETKSLSEASFHSAEATLIRDDLPPANSGGGMIEKYFSAAKEKASAVSNNSVADQNDSVIVHKKKKTRKKGKVSANKSSADSQNVGNISDHLSERSWDQSTCSSDYSDTIMANLTEGEVLRTSNQTDVLKNCGTAPALLQGLGDDPIPSQSMSHSQLRNDIARLNKETLDLLNSRTVPQSPDHDTDIYSAFAKANASSREESPHKGWVNIPESALPSTSHSQPPVACSPPGLESRRKSEVVPAELSSATVTAVETANEGIVRNLSACDVQNILENRSVLSSSLLSDDNPLLSSLPVGRTRQGNSLGLEGHGWSSPFQQGLHEQTELPGSFSDGIQSSGSHSDHGHHGAGRGLNDLPEAEKYSVSPAEEAGFEYEILSSSDILTNIEGLEECFGVLRSEQGLDFQNYQCKGCTRPVGIIYGKPRVCAYDGFNYCYECHENDEFHIPARIVHNWDFRKHKVARRCLEYMKACETRPLLHIEKMNPRLYDHIPEMKEIKELRTQLQHLKAYLYTCKQSVADELRRQVWPREHLYEDVHLYSLQDIEQVPSGQLAATLRKVIKFATKHVYSCSLCGQKGFICEICDNPKVIYPFELETTVKCTMCQAVFHKDCKSDLKSCPRCARRRTRTSSLQRTAADQMDYAYLPQNVQT